MSQSGDVSLKAKPRLESINDLCPPRRRRPDYTTRRNASTKPTRTYRPARSGRLLACELVHKRLRNGLSPGPGRGATARGRKWSSEPEFLRQDVSESRFAEGAELS